MLDTQIKQKKRIHLGFLIFLFLFHLVQLVLYEMVREGLWSLSETFVKIVLGVVAFGLAAASMGFIKYFIRPKSLFIVYVVLFVICIVFQLLSLGLDLRTGKGSITHVLLLCAVGISIFVFFSILILTVRDIFVEKHDLTYSLLGAANIFLSIIITFSFIIFLIVLSYPHLMPQAANVNEVNNICFIISSYSVAGIDFPYENVPRIIKNITAFQSIIMHLYAVMIVGRLLSR